MSVSDGVLLVGAALLSVGAGMAWLPGGLMAAGALCILFVVLTGGFES